MGQFIVSNDKHRVCTFLSRFCIPLCHSPEILAKCSLPHFGCGWIIHQFPVAGYCFTHDGMHHGTGEMFEHHREALLHVLHEAPWCEFIVCHNFFLDGEYVVACLVTILCRAPLGISVNVVGGGIACPLGDLLLTHCVSSLHPTFISPLHSGQMHVIGAMMGTHAIAGTAPGVLFRFTLQCRQGVSFSARFVGGFRDCIIGGAFVMRGMGRMGVLTITLCCCILTLCSCSVASCSVIRAGGSTICLILFWSIFMRRHPVGVLSAVAVSLASSSVRAQKCWSGVKVGNWQCCGKSSVDPDMQYALISGM